MTDAVRRRLLECPLEVNGRISGASNATLHCTVDDELSCVYKPQRGERPLWDFPTGTLTGREVACFEIDRVLGFGLIPPTVWREEGPAGPGMCQMWVEEDDEARLVDVVPPDRVAPGWIPVLRATDGLGSPVVLAHANHDRLQAMAILDAVVNNGDRKGGHVITDHEGGVWAVDHGVTLSVEPKLRTVLWGWAGLPIPGHLLEAVGRLHERVRDGIPEITRWLERHEVEALMQRCQMLVDTEEFPSPNEDWPAIPWPVF